MDYAQVYQLNVFSVFKKLPRLTSNFAIYVHPSAGHMVQLSSYRRDFRYIYIRGVTKNIFKKLRFYNIRQKQQALYVKI